MAPTVVKSVVTMVQMIWSTPGATALDCQYFLNFVRAGSAQKPDCMEFALLTTLSLFAHLMV